MKKISIIIALSAIVVGLLPSCKKSSSSSSEKTVVSTPPYQIGQPITPGNLNAGSYKGTMTSGNTYNLKGDFTINAGDTVLLQSGVNVCVSPNVTIIVKGVLISLGTQSAPNYIEPCGITAFDNIEQAPANDPAWNNGIGTWTGINCDTSCRLLDLQWTHIGYCGASFPVTENFVGGTQGATSFGILFQNPKGDCIMTDSWIYGTIDDAVRFAGGRIYFARNTLEKMGYTGGDGLNAKNGTQGDMCFNLCVGNATNSTKCSNKGGSATECNINMYNNTYINCGYRQAQYVPRGSDIDYEQQGEGVCYNNLIVNCRNGIRVGNGENQIPWPDTNHLTVGYNYVYADSTDLASQFFDYNAGSGLRPNAYVIPTASQLNLPVGFYDPTSNPGGDVLKLPGTDSTALAGANKPMFVNFPLPEPIPASGTMSEICSVNTGVALTGSAYNFHLQAGSPAVGKGYTGFSPFQNIINPVTADVKNPNFAPVISQPGTDIGCFQTNGSGNQH